MQILELAEYYNLSTEEQNVYDIAFNKAWATFDAVETAKKEGERKKQLEIARGMLNKGLDISLISELTSLSQEEILNLEIIKI